MSQPALPRFLHLRLRSACSLREGTIHVRDLPKIAERLAMPAIGLADTNNLFGALEFAEAAAKVGIQPVMGLQLAVRTVAPRLGERAEEPTPLVLYAKDQPGWLNLMRLASAAYLETEAGALPHVALDRVEALAEGLICLTGGSEGALARHLAAGREAAAEALAGRLALAFGDRLYVELQRHGTGGDPRTPAEAASEPALIDLAYRRGLPLVATNDVFFEAPGMHRAHDAFLCIGEGRYVGEPERRRVTPEHYAKTQAEMALRFADLPEALEMTVEIARRCAVRPRTRAPILPRFAEDEVEALGRAARAGLARRLEAIPMVAPRADYEARLEYELGVIEQMGFPGYFLIVADFIQWAKAQRIPVGPGRGSGAGSLVAYALTITDLDPLRYGLLFERFLNPERVSMPDFDIDFCQDRREEVIAYVASRYGADRVAQIITFGALLSKAAVRDVARVLQQPYAVGDRLSKLIPVKGVKPLSIAEALAEEPRLAEEAKADETVAELLDIAGQLEGLYRNASTHAAGVVIGDRPLVELTPLYRDPRSEMPATQWNMKWAEAAGLVKFDFLGLKTLTVIQNAIDLLAERGVEIDIATIPLDDPATYALYARAEVAGVFQVESPGMRDALRQLRPTTIEDIVALVALYRPGPMENIPLYCRVKHGETPMSVPHPALEPMLRETMGIIVYQEQVMEIARLLAGYTLGGADLLRRAMGKKIKAAMDEERPKFVAGCVTQGISTAKADEIFDLLAKFADYGFNKSHAAAYALVSYQTAWLKANHPVEFMAATMNLDLGNTEKLGAYVRECRRMGIGLGPPCVNRSGARFTVAEGAVHYALGALKGVGLDAMARIVAARGARPFADLFDLARRVDLKAIGKRPLEALARAGAFDRLAPNRRQVLAGLDQVVDYSATHHAEEGSSQVSLFGAGSEALPPPRLPRLPDWPAHERLREEHAAIGFYLSSHPLESYRALLSSRRIESYAGFIARARGGISGRIAATIGEVKIRKSARGNRFATIQASDLSGGFEVMAFSDVLEANRALLVPGANLVLTVATDGRDEGDRLLLRAADELDRLALAEARTVRVHVEDADALRSIAARLASPTATRRAERKASVTLVLTLADQGREVDVVLADPVPIGPGLAQALKDVPGVQRVDLV